MPEESRKTKTDELLASADKVMEQAKSLRTDITREMRRQRAHDRPVSQPLGPRRVPKRRN